MFHRWAALALVLALWCLAPESAAGQSGPPDQQPRARKTGMLGQNYPNPFNPDTNIPFSLACDESGGGDYVVSLRIYNVLAQPIAVAVMQGGNDAIDNVRLSCGDYIAFWDGKERGSGRDAPAGIYIYELVVDGERSAKKMYIAK